MGASLVQLQEFTANTSLNKMILFLLYLGPNEVQALQLMKKITQQHIYILSLNELY